MKKTIDLVALLKPLFDEYRVKMKPASEHALTLFKKRAAERKIPQQVVTQLVDFYSIVNGVPCLNSLDIHRAGDNILFEWWDQEELWLGQRDFYTLRWSRAKDRFCIGDAGNVSFSASDEYRTFAEALSAHRNGVRISGLAEWIKAGVAADYVFALVVFRNEQPSAKRSHTIVPPYQPAV